MSARSVIEHALRAYYADSAEPNGTARDLLDGYRAEVLAEEKASADAPTATPQLDERLGRLADHILDAGGEWTTRSAHRWLVANVDPGVARYRARHALQHLAALGYLIERDHKGRRSYTPNYARGEA